MFLVIDTSVLFSSFKGRGASHAVLGLWRRGIIRIAITSEIVKEYKRVLIEANLLNNDELKDLDRLLANPRHSVLVYPKKRFEIIRDPTDDKFIDAAVEAKVDVVVANDKDLLDIKSFEGIPIMPPGKFLFQHRDKLIE